MAQQLGDVLIAEPQAWARLRYVLPRQRPRVVIQQLADRVRFFHAADEAEAHGVRLAWSTGDYVSYPPVERGPFKGQQS